METPTIPIYVTEKELKTIHYERRIQAEREAVWAKQDACKHPNAYTTGTWGHNGDEWRQCPDCNKEWRDD